MLNIKAKDSKLPMDERENQKENYKIFWNDYKIMKIMKMWHIIIKQSYWDIYRFLYLLEKKSKWKIKAFISRSKNTDTKFPGYFKWNHSTYKKANTLSLSGNYSKNARLV